MGILQEHTPRDKWTKPGFVRTVITAVWGLAFAVVVAAEFALLYFPQNPKWLGIGVTVAAIYGAIQITTGYSETLRGKAALHP
jgi:hypothetical protein